MGDGVISKFAAVIKLGDREKTTAKRLIRRSVNRHIPHDYGFVRL